MLSQRCSTVFLPQMPEHLSPLVSIIVPFFNEQDSLVELVREIESQFTAIKHELILVDDGSTDASLKVALSLANDAIKVVALDSNHGQSMAIKAGIDCSTGFLLATMDADGQNLPNDLLPMIQLLQSEQGAQIQMVQGIRTMRIDSWQKRLPSRVRQLHYSQMVGCFRHRHWVLVARVSEGSVD
jgi:glycosyltransferase involved in cell wall biosynthesis